MKGPQVSVFNFSIKNQGGASVDIFIDGAIVDAESQAFYRDFFGDDTTTSYKSFRDLLNKIDASVYNVYINSGGGQVAEAMAIHDLLKEYQNNGKTVNTIGRGIVASSATYILMAGKSPTLTANSWLMIHNVNGFCYGDVNTIENYAVTMRKFNDAANTFYQNATGLSKTVISNLMDAETWMTADEAKAKNFVKNITGEVSFTNSIKPDQWLFSNTAVLNAYNSFTNNSSTMDTKKITDAINNGFTAMLEKLGLKDKAGDDSVKNALTEFSTSITTSITNSMAEIKVPDDAAIKNMVDTAIAEAFKTVPENFIKAITDAMVNTVTKEDIKNMLTKETLTAELAIFNKTMTDSIAGLVGNKSGSETKEKKEVKSNFPKNRFVGATVWTDDN